MISVWMKVPEWGRAATAALLCVGLFTSDLVTSVEMNESQLYPVAMVTLYRIRNRSIVWLLGGLAVALTVAGYLMAPPADVWDGMTNRAFSLLVIVLTVV